MIPHSSAKKLTMACITTTGSLMFNVQMLIGFWVALDFMGIQLTPYDCKNTKKYNGNIKSYHFFSNYS